jgi:ribosome-associated protein
MSEPLVVSPSLTIPASALSWSAARSSGPGGQNVNKVASKIELRFELETCAELDVHTRERLRSLARTKIDAEGRILIVSQLTRDQSRNLEDAREKLRELILAATVRPKRRRATKPSRAANARRVEGKRRQGDKKAGRRGGHE